MAVCTALFNDDVDFRTSTTTVVIADHVLLDEGDSIGIRTLLSPHASAERLYNNKSSDYIVQKQLSNF